MGPYLIMLTREAVEAHSWIILFQNVRWTLAISLPPFFVGDEWDIVVIVIVACDTIVI